MCRSGPEIEEPQDHSIAPQKPREEGASKRRDGTTKVITTKHSVKMTIQKNPLGFTK